MRKSKKSKTEEPPPAQKTGRGRLVKDRVAKEPKNHAATLSVGKEGDDLPSAPIMTATITATTSARKKPARTKTSARVSPPPPQQQGQVVKVPKRTARRAVRPSEENGGEDPSVMTAGSSGDGAAATTAETKRRAPRAKEPSPPRETSTQSKITLPISDTPIINRNKEMRKKGTGARRSSLGSRGRRASSLIDSGHTAIPHRDVRTHEFYKHIEAEGLPEPRRMRQLLMWCGERALEEKPPHGTPNSAAIHGGKEGGAT